MQYTSPIQDDQNMDFPYKQHSAQTFGESASPVARLDLQHSGHYDMTFNGQKESAVPSSLDVSGSTNMDDPTPNAQDEPQTSQSITSANISKPQRARLDQMLHSIEQFRNKDHLEQIYMLNDKKSAKYKLFWQQAINRLYKEVFMNVTLSKGVIMERFIVGDLFPSGLRTLIDMLVEDGVLIDREEYILKGLQVKQKSWFDSIKNVFNGQRKVQKNPFEQVLVSREYLDYYLQQLLQWAEASHQSVMSYHQYEAQLFASLEDPDLESRHKTFQLIHKYIKEQCLYSEQLVFPEGITLVKLGYKPTIDKLDRTLFALKGHIRSFTEALNESQSLYQQISTHIQTSKERNSYHLIIKLAILLQITQNKQFLLSTLEQQFNLILQYRSQQQQLSAYNEIQKALMHIENDTEKVKVINETVSYDIYRQLTELQEKTLLDMGVTLREEEVEKLMCEYQ